MSYENVKDDFFIDNLELLKLVNISFNLMTHAFDSRVILEEEIRG